MEDNLKEYLASLDEAVDKSDSAFDKGISFISAGAIALAFSTVPKFDIVVLKGWFT